MLDVWSRGPWQVTIKLHRGKKRQEKETAPGSEIYQLTANADQMVQSSPVRFLRMQLLRGVFAARLSPCLLFTIHRSSGVASLVVAELELPGKYFSEDSV